MKACMDCGQPIHDHRCQSCGQSVAHPPANRTIAGFDGRGRMLYEDSEPRIIATAKSQDGDVLVTHCGVTNHLPPFREAA